MRWRRSSATSSTPPGCSRGPSLRGPRLCCGVGWLRPVSWEAVPAPAPCSPPGPVQKGRSPHGADQEPRADRQDARSGAGRRRHPRGHARGRRARRDDQGPGPGRPQGPRGARRQAELPRVRRLPRHHLHLGERGRRPRHPVRRRGPQGRRRHLHRLRRDHRRLARRRRLHGLRRLRSLPGAGRAVPGDRGVHVGGHRGHEAGQPPGGRLPRHRDLHPPPAASPAAASTGSSRTTAATASAPRCTWTRIC
ncbi:hypothetical protein STENM327S_01110 [Streptomyces tendae]